MRLVVFSPFFHPRIGGLETLVQVLASEWTRMGDKVTVITDTPHDQPDSFTFDVLRRPHFWRTVATYRQADVVILANISLWGLLPLLFCFPRRPPWIVTHQIWYENPGKPAKLLDRLKKAVSRFATANISCSLAVDQFLGLNAHVIPNPYDHHLFRLMPEVRRDRELVFLGRLVSDKGCDVLIDALSILLARDLTPSLTIIGSGPEQEALKEQVKHLGLSGQVSFVGPLSGEPLVRLLNQHQIMVVPSRWDEPFGIVALEGIACGCFVIGSAGGGLREAIGECGVTFPNRNASALAELLHCTLTSRSTRLRNGNEIDMHLQRHRSHVIASSYRQIFHSTRDPILEADGNPT